MPGCREPVREGLNGFLVPPRNAQKLAAAMDRFLADPALAVEMGANARRCAEEQYDVDKVNALLIDCMRLDRTTRPAASAPAPLPPQAPPSLGRPRPLPRLIYPIIASVGLTLLSPLTPAVTP